MATLEQYPIRARDVGALGKVIAAALGGALGGALTVGLVVFGAGSWKGAVDVRLSALTDGLERLQLQVDRMDGKIDRLSESVEKHR